MSLYTRILSSHKKNKERNLAAISLILGSGLRISEALSLDLKNIDWNKAEVSVNRKGNVLDVVTVSDIGMQNLKSYIKICKKRYKVHDPRQYSSPSLLALKDLQIELL